ncbi:GNAT family N-acetyltransferase [Kitasatospora sp. LaBMicrA B282]|uniref:GNAT family N-acetyltransferase n=1 Tax=Kitasatospora sp. LaBMicrA B282 TaxID=3420949 RepID=UPI003D09D858
MKIRTGGPEDVPALLALLDGAVAWLAERGRTGQWGSEPWSSRPAAVERAEQYARDYLMRVAETPDGTVVGACVLARELPAGVAPADLPELYIRLLVTDATRRGSGIGAALIGDARAETARQGLPLLRVDCYGGDDRALVAQYRALGFTETEPFEVVRPDAPPWPGQVLEIRL